VLQAARAAGRRHLRERRPFAWNATNLFRDRRRALIDLCTDYGARVALHYLEPPFDTLFERSRTRPDPIPEAVPWRYLERFDLPEAGEAPNVTVHHSGG
jgi:predicted kinase